MPLAAARALSLIAYCSVPETARALSPSPEREARDALVEVGFYSFPTLLDLFLPPSHNQV